MPTPSVSGPSRCGLVAVRVLTAASSRPARSLSLTRVRRRLLKAPSSPIGLTWTLGHRSGTGSVIGSINTDIKTFGASDGMTLSAGSVSGNIELVDSALQSGGAVTLKADAGRIQHGGGVIERPSLARHSRIGNRRQYSDRHTDRDSQRQRRHRDHQQRRSHRDQGTRGQRDLVENFGSLTAQAVRTFGSSTDNDIVLTTHPLGLSKSLTFNELSAGAGAGDVTLNVAGTIVQTGGPVVADQLNVIVGGGVALATPSELLGLRQITAAGDVSITDTNGAGLRLADVQVLNGSLSVSASGSIIAESVRSLSNLQGNDITLTSAGRKRPHGPDQRGCLQFDAGRSG